LIRKQFVEEGSNCGALGITLFFFPWRRSGKRDINGWSELYSRFHYKPIKMLKISLENL